MQTLHKVIHQFDQEIEDFAIAVRSINSEQNHIGIIYRTANKSLNILHLAFHCDLRNEHVSSKYFWIIPKLDPIEIFHQAKAKVIKTKCRLIWERFQSNISYGIEYGLRFDDELNLKGNSAGFTCATFVLAVFDTCGVRLLDENTWKFRNEDLDWQKKIVDILCQEKASKKHIAKVQNEIGCARFRPEEVAVSSFFDLPAKFEEIEPAGQRLDCFIKCKSL